MATIDPSLLDPSNLATFLNTPVDEPRGILMLTLAANECATIIDPVPAEALGVVLSVAARAFLNPEAATSETVGAWSATRIGGVFLMRAERQHLKTLAGRGGAFTVDPTPTDAGTSLPPWDVNTLWPTGEPLLDEIT